MIRLILGGTKTGKSSYAALKAGQECPEGKELLYIATATHTDQEMTRRIRRHQGDRPEHWITWEEPRNIVPQLEERTRKAGAVILDCLTLLMTNWLMDMGEGHPPEEAERIILRKLEDLIQACQELPIPVYIISNQVEVGLHSPYPLGRLFQDLAGMAHQNIAKAAHKVFVMQAGIPQILKEVNHEL